MRKIIPIIGLPLLLISCQKNFLTYKYKPFFSERNWISNQKDTLKQVVTYNLPWVIDEEHSYELTIIFLDTTQAKEKRVLDLTVDTAIIKVRPLFWSVWIWDAHMNHLDGTSLGIIKIQKWEEDKIRLKQNVKVYDPIVKKKRKFKGVRTFRK